MALTSLPLRVCLVAVCCGPGTQVTSPKGSAQFCRMNVGQAALCAVLPEQLHLVPLVEHTRSWSGEGLTEVSVAWTGRCGLL